MLPDKDFLLKLAQSLPSELTPEDQEKSSLLKKESLLRPLLMVNCSTSGIVAGAKQTWEAIENYASDRSLDIDLLETGSIGLSSEEPVVSVQLPGRTRLFFSKVTADRIPNLLDDLFHHVVPDQKLIGQQRHSGHEPWSDLPYLDEIPFFALQKRIVMGDCGIIDPFHWESILLGEDIKHF